MESLKNIKLLWFMSLSLGGFVAETCLAAEKKYIAVTQIVSHPALDAVRAGIKEKVVAYAAKHKIELLWVYENAQGNIAISAQIANKFAGSDPDIIVAISTPSAQTAVSATRGLDIPVVFSAVTDPVAAKLVANLEKPGDRVTGTYDFPPIGKQLDLMQTLLPQAKTVGILYSPGEINSVRQLDVFKKEAEARGLKVVEGAAVKSSEVIPATQKLLTTVDVIYVPQDNTIMSTLSGVTTIAAQQGKAVIVPDPEGVKSGGLATIGYSHLAEGHACGDVIIRILQGEDPGTIAVKLPDEEKIFINIQIANALGIKIPQTLIDKAFIWR
jgi:putative tryptophan/tyrosine transport system substrate-binding protein